MNTSCMATEIRRAGDDDDFASLRELFAEYEASLPPELRHGALTEAAALRAEYGGNNAAFLATTDGRPIGCVAVTALDGARGLLRHLFVTPQGRGLGVARSLVSHAISFLRERGFLRVVLDTDKRQLEAAYRLYVSLGFEECGPHGAVTYASPTFMELPL